mmetsp:Transcript_6515/g.21883  ORF Transcript_6515/g.21883 Transcript_6515/m.21883 type:complete len:259 (-) Transcript_6515:380-1156(-)
MDIRGQRNTLLLPRVLPVPCRFMFLPHLQPHLRHRSPRYGPAVRGLNFNRGALTRGVRACFAKRGVAPPSFLEPRQPSTLRATKRGLNRNRRGLLNRGALELLSRFREVGFYFHEAKGWGIGVFGIGFRRIDCLLFFFGTLSRKRRAVLLRRTDRLGSRQIRVSFRNELASHSTASRHGLNQRHAVVVVVDTEPRAGRVRDFFLERAPGAGRFVFGIGLALPRHQSPRRRLLPPHRLPVTRRQGDHPPNRSVRTEGLR